MNLYQYYRVVVVYLALKDIVSKLIFLLAAIPVLFSML